MTTMKEIAERTGVSISTVSLVLNNRDVGRVKPSVAEKVRKIAKTLGYRPNPLARSLRTSKTRILGFVSDEIATTPYAGRLILGAQDAARSLGYMLLTVNTNGDADLEDHEISTLKQYGVDGFIYARMFNQRTKLPTGMSPLPTVLLDGSDVDGRTPSIVPDEESIGYDATRHLIRAGCRHIAYIGAVDRAYAADTGRRAGYRRALQEAGRPFDSRLEAGTTFNQPALDAVERLFDEQHPDGFFCFNDARAWYVYEAAARRGLVVGRDISVVGVDNHRIFAETLAPQLTTVDLPHYEMGYWSTLKLVALIEHRSLGGLPLPETRSPIPPLDTNTARIHCTLIRKKSVVGM
ncbi:LacI family DNA-binding transcriptional regulator [Bifidobacterium sp. 82T24]|uniref:LacI family DNA-binding transcriptional regulator n=1 Tax=Bifidobacterium pluvialisilvae TaxID=2834436 RepID=UPI001C580FE5|nr:LacI family DNA-binding transcriptional regulator [Bifidobacterium pluvialisilvae]MBW3087732.1 LacI family DNA-binding transcriptional regulator [Bifidobacterium pluvialisilvae]